MGTDRKGQLTPADMAAARKLQRLWAARANPRELTQDAFAAQMDITQGAVSQYVNGKIALNYGAVLAFAKALGCDPKAIRDDLPEQRLQRSVSANDDDWANILAVRQPAALGAGAEPDEYAETHKLKFRLDSLRRKGLHNHRLAVCYGKGESMLPRIRPGDAILFDRDDTTPRDGELYVVTYGRDVLAKRLVDLGGRWFIESLNKDDPKWRKPEPIDAHRGFEVHGRVRWIGSWED